MEAYGICALHQLDKHPTQKKYTMHSHEAHEILLLLSDSCAFQVGDWLYHMEKGDAVIIPGGVQHRLIWESDEESDSPVEFYYIQFESEILPCEASLNADLEYLCREAHNDGRFVWRLDSSALDLVKSCLQRMVQIHDTNVLEIYLSYLRPVLREIHLCAGVVAGSKGNVRRQFRNGALLFDEVSLYIHEHYADIKDLSFVPDVFHYSVVYVNSLFKRYVELSLWQYVITVRLDRVHDRLMEGAPVEKAARDCGFDDYSNFYRMFRKRYGITPTEYKKQRDNKNT